MFKFFAPKLIKLTLILLVPVSFLVLGNLYTYKRLTSEKQIAQLTFTPIHQQEYDATLKLGNFCEARNFRIYGDEWRIDTQFLKWKSWATLFGLDAMYRIDRLSGRYTSIEDEKNKSHSAHDLKTPSTLDLAKLANKYNNKFPPVDTVYGSSAYTKMKPNTVYIVSVTQSGILIREKEQTSIPDESNCIVDNSKWNNTVVELDQKLASFIASIK
jgi:hypothetical protein